MRNPNISYKPERMFILTLMVLAFGVFPGAKLSAITINLNFSPITSAEARAGYQRAAAVWEATIADDFVLNLDISHEPIDGTALGRTTSTKVTDLFSNVRTALAQKGTSGADMTANASLAGEGTSLGFLTNEDGTGNLIFDNNNSVNNFGMFITTANAKVLGLRSPTDTAVDGSIVSNSNYNWDFDQSDGVGVGQQDFVGVNVHEIGHALGFISGVDTVDRFIGTDTGLEGFAVMNTLDLFRYGDRFGTGALRDMAVGGNSFFSLDNGATSIAEFSTGRRNGDGQQASHWKDDQDLGLLDPTTNASGADNMLSELDLLAFDVIGYTIIPEPSSLSLVALGALALLSARRRVS